MRFIGKSLVFLSFVLLVVTAGLWELSFFRQDGAQKIIPGTEIYYGLSVENATHAVAVDITWQSATYQPPAFSEENSEFRERTYREFPKWRTFTFEPYTNDDFSYLLRVPNGHSFQLLGTIFCYQSNLPQNAGYHFIIPHLQLVILFGILPARWLWVYLRTRKRLRANACPKCNYDLRATPDRCPECGAAPGKAAEPA